MNENDVLMEDVLRKINNKDLDHNNIAIYCEIFKILTNNNKEKNYSESNNTIKFALNYIPRDILKQLDDKIDSLYYNKKKNDLFDQDRNVIEKKMRREISDKYSSLSHEIDEYINYTDMKYSSKINDKSDSSDSEDIIGNCNESIKSNSDISSDSDEYRDNNHDYKELFDESDCENDYNYDDE